MFVLITFLEQNNALCSFFISSQTDYLDPVLYVFSFHFICVVLLSTAPFLVCPTPSMSTARRRRGWASQPCGLCLSYKVFALAKQATHLESNFIQSLKKIVHFVLKINLVQLFTS